jgi:hypothetical protein
VDHGRAYRCSVSPTAVATVQGLWWDTGAVGWQDRHFLLSLLDAMDDHFDRRISDHDFRRLATSARNSLMPQDLHDPDLAAAIEALDGFLITTQEGQAPMPRYDTIEIFGTLRCALADLEPSLSDHQPSD